MACSLKADIKMHGKSGIHTNFTALMMIILLLCLQVTCIAAQKTEDKVDLSSTPKNTLNKFSEHDGHYIPLEAYFISIPLDTNFIGIDLMAGRDWIYVSPALKESSSFLPNKSKENFIQLSDGKHVWTKFFWKSRIAVKDDLKIGTIVISMEKWGGEYYVQPDSYEQSSHYLWCMARIIDTNNIDNGYVTVSGPSKVGIKNLRVIVL